MSTTQELFLNDVKTKIKMYLYRSLEPSFDPTIRFIQDISLLGPINWHLTPNKQRMSNVFIALSEASMSYSLTDGDFRTYILLQMTEILYNEFSDELFKSFVSSSYGVIPESVVGNLETAYSLQPPQNTQFPGLSNGTNPMSPLPQRLIPNVLYEE